MLIVVGVGANQGDTLATFVAVRRRLARRFDVVAASSLWRTRAIGPEQADFVNAALLLRVDLHPLDLLHTCHELETAAGRNRARESRWGPRPLDLDLLVANGCVTVGPDLYLPHPRLELRRFALAPAAEIVPNWSHQRARRTIADLARDPRISDQECTKLGAYPLS